MRDGRPGHLEEPVFVCTISLVARFEAHEQWFNTQIQLAQRSVSDTITANALYGRGERVYSGNVG